MDIRAYFDLFYNQFTKADHWYHKNSDEYRKLLSDMKRIHDIYETSKLTGRISEEDQKKLSSLYYGISQKGSTYLSDKASVRETVLGQERYEICMAAVNEVNHGRAKATIAQHARSQYQELKARAERLPAKAVDMVRTIHIKDLEARAKKSQGDRSNDSRRSMKKVMKPVKPGFTAHVPAEVSHRTCPRGLLLLLTVLLLCLTTGCTEKNDRNDIKNYVREELGLRDFDVSETPRELTDTHDPYTSYLWTVTEADGTRFLVLDDYYYGAEHVANQLLNNRNDVLVKAFMEKYEAAHKAPSSGSENPVIALEVDEELPLKPVSLIGHFRTRKELAELADEIDRISAACPEGLTMWVEFLFDFPYRTIGDYEIKDADQWGNVEAGDAFDRTAMDEGLLHLAVDLHLKDILAEFTESEITSYIQSSSNAIGVRKPDGSYTIYDDLLSSRYSYGLSFPTIYTILEREGYPVTGSENDFTFTALDGSEYELSLDFRENDSYYFIRDGVHVPMEFYFYNHFRVYWLEEKTGIIVRERWEIEE